MTHPTKSCRNCGAPFTASPNDYTVNCPSCRRTAAHRDYAGSNFYADKIAEAKRRGYEARNSGDMVAYYEAVADLQHWQAARDAQ